MLRWRPPCERRASNEARCGAASLGDDGLGAAAVGIVVTLDDGTQVRAQDRLDPDLSGVLFARTGRVTRVTVDLSEEPSTPPA